MSIDWWFVSREMYYFWVKDNDPEDTFIYHGVNRGHWYSDRLKEWIYTETVE